MADGVETGVNRVMLFSLVFLYFLYIKLIDMNLSLPEKYQGIAKKAVAQWVGLVPLIMAIYTGYFICNQAYDRMNTRYENIYAYMNRIAARIEETPGWNHDIPVFFAYPLRVFSNNYEVPIKAYDDLKRMMGTDLYPWYSTEELENSWIKRTSLSYTRSHFIIYAFTEILDIYDQVINALRERNMVLVFL